VILERLRLEGLGYSGSPRRKAAGLPPEGGGQARTRPALQGFYAPEEAGGVGSLHGEIGAPDSKDLRALIDALEAAFGFGHGFDGRHPEVFCIGSVQVDA